MLYWITFATGLIGVNVLSILLLLWCLKPWVAAKNRRRVLAWTVGVFLLFNLPLAVFFFRPLDALLTPFPVTLVEQMFLVSAVWITTLMMYSGIAIAALGLAVLYRAYRSVRYFKGAAWRTEKALPASSASETFTSPVVPGRRKFIAGGMGLALPALYGVAAYGLHGALDDLEVSPELSIPIPYLPRALDGLRVVHLSDIHVGSYLRRRELQSLTERVNALRPDIIAITGDLIDRDMATLSDAVAGLRGLRASQGAYLVIGNHDIYTDPFSFNSRNRGAVRIADAMAEIGVNTLRDETVMIGEGADQLAVMGMDWVVQRGSENLVYDPVRTRAALDFIDGKLAAGTPKILLVHHPETFRECPDYEIGLTLAGHTHGGGQIVLGDFRGQPLGIAMMRFTFLRGLYRKGESSLYVSRGIGYLGLPIRVNCPPEISQFRLTRPA